MDDGGQAAWTAVDAWIEEHLVPADPVLERTLATAAAAGLPAADVSPTQGRLLELLARLAGARRVLEIGTLAGYSTLWLARALPPDGHLLTLESNPAHAAVARATLAGSGLPCELELREGPALDTLDDLLTAGAEPFDLVFIDADKRSTPDYFQRALALTRPGSLIVADNVVRGGAVTDAASDDPSVRGIRRFAELVAAEPRVVATAIQTVGRKGHDGFALALVVAP